MTSIHSDVGTAERLDMIEARMEHLVTREELQQSVDGLKLWILAGMLGGIPVSVGLALVALRFFGFSR